MIFIYLLNGKKYNGDIYFKYESNDKYGFICATDPFFINLLTVINVPYEDLLRKEQKYYNTIISKYF